MEGKVPAQRKMDASTHNEVSPHSFTPIRFWDIFHKNGRCRRCYAPKEAHPIHFWIRARPYGDKQKAELSYEVFSGEKP